jgi:hypothetical protein
MLFALVALSVPLGLDPGPERSRPRRDFYPTPLQPKKDGPGFQKAS